MFNSTCCDLSYRRVTNLDEKNDDPLGTNWNRELEDGPLAYTGAFFEPPTGKKRKRYSGVFGPELPTESDLLDGPGTEKVREFKRVQIVTSSANPLSTSLSEPGPESTWPDDEYPPKSLSSPGPENTWPDDGYPVTSLKPPIGADVLDGPGPEKVCIMCPLCPGKFRKTATTMRHIRDQHFPQELYFCTWPDCGVQMRRKDRILNHVRIHGPSQRLGVGLPARGFDIREILVPSECPICHGGTDSWKVFYHCVSTHFLEVSSDDQNKMIF